MTFLQPVSVARTPDWARPQHVSLNISLAVPLKSHGMGKELLLVYLSSTKKRYLEGKKSIISGRMKITYRGLRWQR